MSVEVTEAHIRGYFDGSGWPEERINSFLDDPVVQLTLIVPPQVAMDIAKEGSPFREFTVVPRMPKRKGDNLDIELWIPRERAMEAMGLIREIYQQHTGENPPEFMDFQSMDKACPGRTVVKAILTLIAESGRSIE